MPKCNSKFFPECATEFSTNFYSFTCSDHVAFIHTEFSTFYETDNVTDNFTNGSTYSIAYVSAK